MSNSEAYDWRRLEAAAEHPVWVESNSQLVELAAHWRSLPLVALDTEFQRVDTFYPIPGLIQLADDQRCYLIDPLSISDYTPLKELLEDRSVLKVLHAATEDLELFMNSVGALPQPLFDTQMAAAYAGWGFSMGLSRMLESFLGVTLDKEETTSDWLQRPLTPAQERYAALDVAYLPAVATELQRLLDEQQRSEWAAQEFETLLAQMPDSDPDGVHYYKRFSQMYRRNDVQLAALRDLSAWREQTSRHDDLPRNRVLRNQALLQLIDRWPQNKPQLGRLSEMRQRSLRLYGDTILQIMQNAERSAAENPPEPIPQPLHVHWAPHMKALKTAARQLAEQWQVPPEVLLRKKELEAIIRSRSEQGQYQLPAEMCEWRQQRVGPVLLEALQALESK
ncbi:ribonuclease D [Marinobacterium arenosum]|uniref:ribonuclease D n=1 Tax=Marinobacterium arenosum TaxID=2862496 RepID=UPI001C986FB5|nr:ribonuclease D [Marinobacterium arenosum]MBY4677600.1 ribonuclease D [Marinobacterium arenosum]